MKKLYWLVLAVLLSGCGSADSPLDELRFATAVPGQGLGEIRLGSQQLGPFADRFGVRGVAAVFTDEDAELELLYATEGLHFNFRLNDACYQATRHLGARLAREMFNPSKFFASYPVCREAILSRILVGVNGRDEAWWQGATVSGSRLGDLWADVMVNEGTPQEHGLGYLALQRTQRQQLESLKYYDGLEVYFLYLDSGQPEEEADRMAMTARYFEIWPARNW